MDQLGLVPLPRNLANPDGSANFALKPAGGARLRQWMGTLLSLATWVNPDGVRLNNVETAVLRRLRPPLNLHKVGEPRSDSARPGSAWRTSQGLGSPEREHEADSDRRPNARPSRGEDSHAHSPDSVVRTWARQRTRGLRRCTLACQR